MLPRPTTERRLGFVSIFPILARIFKQFVTLSIDFLFQALQVLDKVFLAGQVGLNTLHGLMHFGNSDLPLLRFPVPVRTPAKYALSTVRALARIKNAEVAELVNRCAILVHLGHLLVLERVSLNFALDIA